MRSTRKLSHKQSVANEAHPMDECSKGFQAQVEPENAMWMDGKDCEKSGVQLRAPSLAMHGARRHIRYTSTTPTAQLASEPIMPMRKRRPPRCT